MPTSTSYDYTISQYDLNALTILVRRSSISIALDHLASIGTTVSFIFKDVLSSPDKLTLDALVSGYVYTVPVNPVQATVITDGNGNNLNQFDVDNALIVRTKAAKKGWTYAALAFQFKLSTVGSVSAQNADGTNKPWINIFCFDVNGAAVTDPSMFGSVVKTYVDFEPPYDYELIGGEMRQTANLTNDVYFFIQAVPDVPAAYGGSKFMAEGLNLKFLAPGNMFQVDGRVSKLLSYSATNHTNKLRFIIRHQAGLVEDLMITVEIYRQ